MHDYLTGLWWFCGGVVFGTTALLIISDIRTERRKHRQERAHDDNPEEH